MIDSITTAALKFFELAPRYLAVIAITSGIVLFAGDGFLKIFGLTEFAQDNRVWLGGIFLVSTSALVVSGGIWGKDLLLAHYKQRRKVERTTQKIINRLKCLTEDEKQILRFYMAENTRTNILKFDDGVVNRPVANGIIVRAASVAGIHKGLVHNITDFVWEYIQEHQGLLEGETTTYRTDKGRRVW